MQEIQRDMLKFGSVTASFSVYSDFLSYSGGVYKNVAGEISLDAAALKCTYHLNFLGLFDFEVGTGWDI